MTAPHNDCPRCHGTGVIREMHAWGETTVAEVLTCYSCGGRKTMDQWFIIQRGIPVKAEDAISPADPCNFSKEKCRRCQGAGIVQAHSGSVRIQCAECNGRGSRELYTDPTTGSKMWVTPGTRELIAQRQTEWEQKQNLPSIVQIKPPKYLKMPTHDEMIKGMEQLLNAHTPAIIDWAYAGPLDIDAQYCECKREKFGFMFCERWCPDYRHPFDVAVEIKLEPAPKYITPGDLAGTREAIKKAIK